MKRFKNILLYAGMEENEVALARALKLASENQATLTIMDVVKPIPHALGLFTDVASSEELQELVVKDHHEKLQEIADSHKDKGVEISVAVSKGDPATEIVKKVIRDGHDLVVKSVNGQDRWEIIWRNCPLTVENMPVPSVVIETRCRRRV